MTAVVRVQFHGEFTTEWGEGEERFNRLIFIGRNLDREMLREGFARCKNELEYIREDEKHKV